MRRMIAGNWKMNGLREDGVALASAVARQAREAKGLSCYVVLCPPATLIAPVLEAVAGSPVAVGGQNCHAEPDGAFTGEISAEMLADLGCAHVIVGHSERRMGYGETDAAVRARAEAAHRAGLVPIICVGETLDEREAGRTLDVVLRQLDRSLPVGSAAGSGTVVVAYEPVWAIGSGLVPTREDIETVHRALRTRVPAGTPILYGGSAKPDNAGELLAADEVGGLLVGGASLDAGSFWRIVESCA